MNKNTNEKDLIKTLIIENEVRARKDIGSILLVVTGALFIVTALFFLKFFKASAIFPYFLLCMTVIFLIVGILSKKDDKNRPYVRALQINLLLLVAFILNIFTGYKIWLFLSLPIILSCRYYDRRFTIKIGFSACILAIATSFVNAYLSPYIGFIDLNLVSFSSPGTMEYSGWLVSAVLNHGYDMNLILMNSLRLSALPNVLIIILIAIGCTHFIKDAEEMLISSYKAVQQEQERLHLEYYASHDALTGLQNRRALTDHISSLKILPGSSGVIFADLNGLKYTNDTFGHEAGDQMLKQYAQIISGIFRADEVYRISGDEFICMMKNITEETLRDRVSQLHTILEQQEPPLASIGTAYGDNEDIEALIKNAETQMYAEKESIHQRFPETKRTH